MAFGKYANRVKHHFDGFVTFKHATSLKKIGIKSANGFVKEVGYNHEGYKAFAVLKSSQNADADNLFYEYLVGRTINRFSVFLPNFVETYGLYKYDDNKVHNDMSNDPASPDLLRQMQLLDRATTNHGDDNVLANLLKTACMNSKYMAVLIQYIKDATPLVDAVNVLKYKEFRKHDLHTTLFQVYFALNTIQHEFTHYDLHAGNVLLYQPVTGSCIQYHYHLLGGGVVSFRSPYIAKIIDYGRAFFVDKERKEDAIDRSTSTVTTALCHQPECHPPTAFDKKCGSDVGFYYLYDEFGFGSDEDKPQGENKYADTYLLDYIEKKLKKKDNPKIFALCKQWHSNRRQRHPTHSNSVSDAYSVLQDIVQSANVMAANHAKYGPLPKIGDMHIYHDRQPVKFIAAT
jgi:hypothetical protein